MSDVVRPNRRRSIATLALIITMSLLCCGGGAAAATMTAAYFFEGLGKAQASFGFGCGAGGKPVDPDADLPSVNMYGAEQMRNAAIIILVGKEMKIPARGWVIAIATAIQESTLRNLPYLGTRNDHDSLGLFQQRPSQGWGSVEQVQNPRYAAEKFYQALLRVPGWKTMALTDAAQAVQKSAYPDRYADDEPVATQIVNVLADGAARAAGAASDLKCVDSGEIAASGWTSPLRGPIVSGFRTASRKTHDGTDISAGIGTPIRAASGGRVKTVVCNATWPKNGPNWGCERAGGVDVRGCGWYVDIEHAGGIMTRYCHQVRRPAVVVGQRVNAGDVIGWVGSTGHSSGPHLHFEVHTGGDSHSTGAVDPVPFMQQVGAPLGDQA